MRIIGEFANRSLTLLEASTPSTRLPSEFSHSSFSFLSLLSSVRAIFYTSRQGKLNFSFFQRCVIPRFNEACILLAASRDSAIRSFMSAPHRRASRRSSSDKGDSTAAQRKHVCVSHSSFSLSLFVSFSFFFFLFFRSSLSREREYGWSNWWTRVVVNRLKREKARLPSNRVTRSKGRGKRLLFRTPLGRKTTWSACQGH